MKMEIYNFKGEIMDRINELKLTYKVDSDAMFKLGMAYYFGDVVARDKTKAVSYLKKAAKMKNADACKKLAECYDTGNGCKKNKSKAKKYLDLYKQYEKLVPNESVNLKIAQTKVNNLVKYANKNYGNADLYYKAGMMYYDGDGIVEDKKKALKCFFWGACQDNIDSITKMVECYQNGVGCKVDKSYAQFWADKLNKLRQKEADKLKPREKSNAEISQEKPNVNLDNPYAEIDKGKPRVKDVLKYMDTPLGKFNQKHTLYNCPCCGRDMLYISMGTGGDLFEDYITIYNPGSILERVGGIHTRASLQGETTKYLLRCSHCGLQTVKVENRKRDTKKDLYLGDGVIFTVTYEVMSDTPSQYKRAIQKYEGTFKEK